MRAFASRADRSDVEPEGCEEEEEEEEEEGSAAGAVAGGVAVPGGGGFAGVRGRARRSR